MENNQKPQNFSRPINSKASQSDSKQKTELQNSKQSFPRSARRRDHQSIGPRNDSQHNSKQPPGKQQQRSYADKRPRPRGGGSANPSNAYTPERGIACAVNGGVPSAGTGLVEEVDTDEIAGTCSARKAVGEFGDHKTHKRNNLNHLLNFHYVPREHGDYLGNGGIYGIFGSYGVVPVGKKHQKQHKYNKEQFLQANFQFVIKSGAKPHLMTSPDTIIDWVLIEQINIQTTEEPRCPICLYPPVAAKLTRCGHAYCWPCILHYLALNDKSWRKCPICYEAVHVADLKSTAILQQKPFNVNDEINFQLMRRKKGSFFIEKFSSSSIVAQERYPRYSSANDVKVFSKFLLAKRSDILTIIERERAELLADEDTTCPEYVFVQQALNLLNERREQLGDIQNIKDEEDMVECDDAVSNHDVSNGTNNSTENAVTLDEVKLKDYSQMEENEGKDHEEDADEEVEAIDDVAGGGNMCESREYTNPFNTSIAASNEGRGGSNTAGQQRYYYFYQSLDGQNIFLHPLNVKMLQACYGSLEHAPLTIKARILQKESHTMNEDLRRKFTCLGHLPLTCQFSVVEVELKAPIVSPETFALFKDGIVQRRMERERRDREEKRREKRIAAINDRQMGKLVSKGANINLSSSLEFPTCGFDYDLMPPLRTQGNSFSALKSNDVKPVETANVASVAGTSPPGGGPSYSSVIMSSEGSKVSNDVLFPELSMTNNKGKKKTHATPTSTVTTSGGGGQISSRKQFENEIAAANLDGIRSMCTTFGDVMEQAMVRKKTNHTNNKESTVAAPPPPPPPMQNVGKKQKREKKKMVPLL